MRSYRIQVSFYRTDSLDMCPVSGGGQQCALPLDHEEPHELMSVEDLPVEFGEATEKLASYGAKAVGATFIDALPVLMVLNQQEMDRVLAFASTVEEEDDDSE